MPYKLVLLFMAAYNILIIPLVGKKSKTGFELVGLERQNQWFLQPGKERAWFRNKIKITGLPAMGNYPPIWFRSISRL